MTKKITALLALVISIATIVTGVIAFDAHYAKAADTEKSIGQLTEAIGKINDRLDRSSVEDSIRTTQKRLWVLEDRYEEKATPQTVKEEIMDLKTNLDSYKRKAEKMDSKE